MFRGLCRTGGVPRGCLPGVGRGAPPPWMAHPGVAHRGAPLGPRLVVHTGVDHPQPVVAAAGLGVVSGPGRTRGRRGPLKGAGGRRAKEEWRGVPRPGPSVGGPVALGRPVREMPWAGRGLGVALPWRVGVLKGRSAGAAVAPTPRPPLAMYCSPGWISDGTRDSCRSGGCGRSSALPPSELKAPVVVSDPEAGQRRGRRRGPFGRRRTVSQPTGMRAPSSEAAHRVTALRGSYGFWRRRRLLMGVLLPVGLLAGYRVLMSALRRRRSPVVAARGHGPRTRNGRDRARHCL
jgi:hypothetical protein